MRLSSEDTLTVLRWLAGEEVTLPLSFPAQQQPAVGWRSDHTPSSGATLYSLFGREEVERLSQCLYEADSSLTGNWLVVTLNKTEVPAGVDRSEVALAVAQAVNSCMDALLRDDHAIYSPKSFVAKAIASAVEEAGEAARIKGGER